jgi:L-serine dehydratase
MEECISVFDMLKIGVGPSSSHTLGPWRAAERFLAELRKENRLIQVTSIRVDLYGSLSLTGKGHATDLAVMLGLSNQNPETIPVEDIKGITDQIIKEKTIHLGGENTIEFDPKTAIVFNKNFLPFHSNGIKFSAFLNENDQYEATYYSIGGGFVVVEERVNAKK